MSTVQPEGNYFNKYESNNPIYKKLMDGFFSSLHHLLKQIKFETIYEAGCGEGNISNSIKHISPENIIKASDISSKKIKQAVIDFPSISFETASIYELPEQDNQYDLVVACEVLEHLEQPEKALVELLRISKKHIIVSVPNEPIWRISNLARGKYLKDLGNTPGHIKHWSKGQFVAFIRQYCNIISVESPFPWTFLLCEKNEVAES